MKHSTYQEKTIAIVMVVMVNSV